MSNLNDIKTRLDNLRNELKDSPITLPDIPKLNVEDIENQEDKLTERQYAFCMYYAAGNNGTKSAELAGFSAKTARQKASQLLTLLKVRKQIEILSAGLVKVKATDKNFIKFQIFKLIEQMIYEEKIPFNNILQALDMINKMDGNYEKLDNNTYININQLEKIQIEIIKPKPIEGLDVEDEEIDNDIDE